MAITVERLQAEVEADASGAISELASFDAALSATARDRTANVDVDLSNALSELGTLEGALKAASSNHTARIDVEADASGLAAFEAAMAAATRTRTAKIDVDVDMGAAALQGALAGLASAASAVTDALGSIARSAGSAVSALGGMAGAATSATQAASSMGSAAASAAGGIGGMGGAAGQAGGSMASFGGSMLSVVATVVTMVPMVIALGVALTAIYTAATIAIGAIHMLSAAIVGLIATISPLIGLLGAIPVGLGAIGGGIGTVILGMGGIGKALGAMDQAQAASTRSTYNAAAAARELKWARQGIVDANKAVERAEHELKRATENVARAQEEAARRLVDQRREVRNAVWAEEDAVERLKRAQENLARAQAGVGKSGATLSRATDDFTGKIYEIAQVSQDAVDGYDAQKEAQRELIRAQEDLERAIERRKDLQYDLAIAEKKGIFGSDIYKDAIRRQEDAQMALARAKDNVIAAHERLARIQAEQAERARGGAAANSALAKAMNDLTPAGREFVRFLHNEFMPAWKKVQQAAQEGLLPGVQAGLESLMRAFPTMENEAYTWGQLMGEHFDEILSHFTTDHMIHEFEKLSKIFRDVMFGDAKKGTKGFMDAIIPLGEIFIEITKAAAPMTRMLTDDLVGALESLAAWMKKPENAERMENFFTNAYEFTKLWGDVLRPLTGVFSSLTTAAKPLATWILESLAGHLDNLNVWMKDDTNRAKVTQWFEDMKPALSETFGLLVDFFKMLFAPDQQGSAESPFTRTIKALREDFIPALERLFTTLGEDSETGPAFVGFLVSLVEMIEALVSDPQAIKDFIDDLGTLISTLADLMSTVQDVSGSSVWRVLWSVMTPPVFDILIAFGKIEKFLSESPGKWESDIIPKFKAFTDGVAAALDLLPIIGPMLSELATWAGTWWSEFLTIFDGESLGSGIYKAFSALGAEIRRSFADALNPIIQNINRMIDVANKLNPFGDLKHLQYIDMYKGASGGGLTKGGKGSGYLSGSSTAPKMTSTSRTVSRGQIGMRQFGGKVEGGQSYIVGEKRPELLTLPEGQNGRIAAAVPREAMQSTGPGITEAQLERVLEAVLAKAKPNVDLDVNVEGTADPRAIAAEVAWAVR